MKLEVHFIFDSPEENDHLRFLESLKGLVDFEKRNADKPSKEREIESDLKVFTRLMKNPVRRQHVRFAYEIAKEIREALQELSQMRPHPDWAKATEAAKAKGEVTLFANPVQFCKDMRDLRKQQIVTMNEVLKMLRDALDVLDEVEGNLPFRSSWDETETEWDERLRTGRG